ncbi:MAG: hypothetical protein ACP5UQ_06200, partial [Anaerolineae bacterium]
MTAPDDKVAVGVGEVGRAGEGVAVRVAVAEGVDVRIGVGVPVAGDVCVAVAEGVSVRVGVAVSMAAAVRMISTLKDVVAQRHSLGARGVPRVIVKFRPHQAIALAADGVVGDGELIAGREAEVQGVAHGAAIVHVVGEGLAVEEAAVADDDRVLDEERPAEVLNLVTGIPFGQGAADGDGGVGFPDVKKIQSVGGVVADDRVFDEPVAAAQPGSEAVAIATGCLAP